MRLDKMGVNAYKKVMTQSVASKELKIAPLAEKTVLPSLHQKPLNHPSIAQERLTNLLVQKERINAIKASNKSGSQKSAELLLLMGKEEAAKVLQHMNIDEVSRVIREITLIKDGSMSDAQKNLGTDTTSLKYRGGIDVARGFLKVAFGDDESERILQNASIDLFDKPFSFLEDLETEQLLSLLKDESIETLAVILPRIKAVTAKEILKVVPFYDQADLIRRIAQNRKVDGSIIAKMEDVLHQRIRLQGGKVYLEALDGKKALAEILRYMSSSDEQKIMEELATTIPDEIKAIEDNLFGIDTLLLVNDRDLQDILQPMNENELAVLLKGKNSDIRKKILKNVSERKRALIKQEETIIGPMRLSEVDKATREFLDMLRLKEKSGKITLLREGDLFI